MKEDPTDHLIQHLLDGTLEDDSRAELNDILRNSPEARDRYRRAFALHSALIRRDASKLPDFLSRSEAPKKVSFFRRESLQAVAALIIVALILGSSGMFALHRLKPRAEILESNLAVYQTGTHHLSPGKMPADVPVELVSGDVKLAYPSGALVILEAPCRFRLDTKEALTILHGRASVHAPPGAEGFRLDTPTGQIIDRGTEFGVAVGNDGKNPVVLTEVFKGEIEVSTQSTDKVLLTDGESRAITNDGTLLEQLDESPVHLANALHRTSQMSRSSTGNLALGKPVISPGYLTRPHGSIFPPDNLTDGRLDDSGVPGDWSFWLAPEHEGGEFIVDLLDTHEVSLVSLQGTTNRAIDDRGAASVELLGSLDNKTYFPLSGGPMPRIDPSLYGQSFPFEDFNFPPVELRYLKCIITSYYKHPTRPADHRNQGGGLNEIRIFSE
ncbi:FecR domain-containing protein [Haloferula chungangensis]|uniref:FecR domain-containing protein n=1 Tax=Haloferula chungangensis TaxID=1048331 RepID=A0ABW2L3C4_9BACT